MDFSFASLANLASLIAAMPGSLALVVAASWWIFRS